MSTYSYRISNKPVLHPEFKRSVKELPKTYNLDFKPRFYKFINTFGTHYITKVISVSPSLQFTQLVLSGLQRPIKLQQYNTMQVKSVNRKDYIFWFSQVTLGGSVQSVTSIRQCETALQGLSADEVKTCLDVEANASIRGKVDMKAESKHCNEDKDKTEHKSSFSSRFNDRWV